MSAVVHFDSLICFDLVCVETRNNKQYLDGGSVTVGSSFFFFETQKSIQETEMKWISNNLNWSVTVSEASSDRRKNIEIIAWRQSFTLQCQSLAPRPHTSRKFKVKFILFIAVGLHIMGIEQNADIISESEPNSERDKSTIVPRPPIQLHCHLDSNRTDRCEQSKQDTARCQRAHTHSLITSRSAYTCPLCAQLLVLSS